MAKQKVLEISLNWSRNKSCDLSFVSDVNVLAHIIHVGCCQFVNYCHVDIHHVHSPSTDEQNDVALFAENSRKYVVRSLNKYNLDRSQPIIATKHSYSDWTLLQKAYKSNPNFDTTHILMDDIISNLCLRTKTVTYLAERFSKLDLNKSGYIEYDEFCVAFGRDPNEKSKQMKNLFNVFNTDDQHDSFGRIDFHEFLVGVATCFMDDKINDAAKIMFNANKDENDLKYMVKENVLITYKRNVDKSKIDGDYGEWLKKMETFVTVIFGDCDKLTFDEFIERIELNKYENMVQHYLQSIIMMRLKIKLSKKDFTIKKEGIYVNPLSELVRSTSIQNVVQT